MLPRLLVAVILSLLCINAVAVTPRKPPAPLTAPADAIDTATGMRYVVLKPAADQSRTVTSEFVEYRADIWSADGVTRFNATDDGNQSVAVRTLIQTLPGLARAVLTTPIGETRRWWIDAPRLGSYPGMPALTHVIDLTVIGAGANPAPPPPDVAAVPADALRTASGLAYRVLTQGSGRGQPSLDSSIEIHYSGWTPDGRLFDSSVVRGQRVTFVVNQLIRGWQEGMQLMHPGDSYRFWIPGYLAYDGLDQPGAPKGMLVFDVTLFSFTP